MDHFLELGDGRKLCWRRYGKEKDKAVIYFHGTPSSRKEPQLLAAYGTDLDQLLEKAGISLIAFDRPGIGLSDNYAATSYVSVARDISRLMEKLGIARADLICWSGGGPYALAMAAAFPGLVNRVFILCGFTKLLDADVRQTMGVNRHYFTMARYCSLPLKAGMFFLKRKKLKKFLPQKWTGLAWEDYRLLKDPVQLNAVVEATLQAACERSVVGPVAEAVRYTKEFDFDLASIRNPVHYWWGTLDMSVSSAHPRHLEEMLPSAVMHYREGEGHLSMYIKGMEEICKMIGDPLF